MQILRTAKPNLKYFLKHQLTKPMIANSAYGYLIPIIANKVSLYTETPPPSQNFEGAGPKTNSIKSENK